MAAKSNGGGEQEVLRKGPWMPEEDEILVEYVNQYGPRDWSSIRSKGLLPRTGKSCRLRWVNKLKPDLKSGCKFSPEEEKLVVEMQAKLGNKWAKIASYLPGRTDNDVKNFWSTRQKRLLRALQRPKGADSNNGGPGVSYGVDGGDHIDHLGNAHCFNEFSTFQAQQQVGGGFSCSGAYNGGLATAETSDHNNNNNNRGGGGAAALEDNRGDHLFIRGQRLMMRNPPPPNNNHHNPLSFHNNNNNNNNNRIVAPPPHSSSSSADLFMVKLQDLLPNFMDTSPPAFPSASPTHPHTTTELCTSRPLPASGGIVSKSLRSMKNRRPRYGSCSTSRSAAAARDIGGAAASSSTTTSAAVGEFHPPAAEVDVSAAAPVFPAEEEQGVFWRDLYGGEPPTTEVEGGGGDYLSDLLMMNYESCCSTAPTTASTNSTSGRPDSPLFGDPAEGCGGGLLDLGFLGGQSQWEKLPLLSSPAGGPPEDGGGRSMAIAPASVMEGIIKEEPLDTSSCTPDSVLLSFPSDVFDSLEPLSPSSSDWWHK